MTLTLGWFENLTADEKAEVLARYDEGERARVYAATGRERAMTSLTPRQARELWCDELESGKWKQGTGQLARETDTGTEYCCLGVACELAIREGIIRGGRVDHTSLGDPYGPVRQWLALADPEGDYRSPGDQSGRSLVISDHIVKRRRQRARRPEQRETL